MVSGGVDSTVCAALLRKALGPHRVIAIHIDNGFMRTNESADVINSLNAIDLDVKGNLIYLKVKLRSRFRFQFCERIS